MVRGRTAFHFFCLQSFFWGQEVKFKYWFNKMGKLSHLCKQILSALLQTCQESVPLQCSHARQSQPVLLQLLPNWSPGFCLIPCPPPAPHQLILNMAAKGIPLKYKSGSITVLETFQHLLISLNESQSPPSGLRGVPGLSSQCLSDLLSYYSTILLWPPGSFLLFPEHLNTQ